MWFKLKTNENICNVLSYSIEYNNKPLMNIRMKESLNDWNSPDFVRQLHSGLLSFAQTNIPGEKKWMWFGFTVIGSEEKYSHTDLVSYSSGLDSHWTWAFIPMYYSPGLNETKNYQLASHSYAWNRKERGTSGLLRWLLKTD